MFVFKIPDEVSVVVALKYGIPPEVTVPDTVTGKALPPPPLLEVPQLITPVADVKLRWLPPLSGQLGNASIVGSTPM
jgi:hypothetical protein